MSCSFVRHRVCAMTKTEFLAKKRKEQQMINRSSMGIFILWILIGFLVFYRDWVLRLPTFVAWALLIGWAFFGSIPPWFLSKRLHRKHRIACPSCGEWLDNHGCLEATGKCPKCQSEFFQDA